MNDYQNMLKEHDMKATSQRIFILKSLDERGHASMDDIYEDLKETNPAMSLTTIYRNINEMMEKSLVSEIKLPRQKQRYEIVKEPHVHLVCESCGKVEDAMVDTRSMIDEAQEKYNCEVLSDAIFLTIKCSECLEKEITK